MFNHQDHDHHHHHHHDHDGCCGVTIKREGEKVGRNDPCPCMSGKKYKKCCLVNAGE